MPDLICTRCGQTSTYADAQMFDHELTCTVYRFDSRGNKQALPATHDWEG